VEGGVQGRKACSFLKKTKKPFSVGIPAAARGRALVFAVSF
jgi:hypothetical protein